MSNEKFPDWAKTAAEDWYPEWNRKLYQYKTFRHSQNSLLKGYIGIISFGLPNHESLSAPELPELFYLYSPQQQKLITAIFDKFEFNEKNRVTVNHTYLFLKNGTVQCVFRQKSKNKVLFFDILGRVYLSWKHFCDTNKSISCPYLAPVDGIHKPDQQLDVYQPSKIWKVLKILDRTMFIGCTVLALALTFTGVGLAATIAIVCGGATYHVGRNIYTLVDRRKHKQSIGLDNAESVACWLTIGTSLITCTSSLALYNAAKIVQVAGRYSNVAKFGLKSLSLASLASNVGNCATHFYYLHQKRLSGEEITSSDAFGVIVNLFLTCGAVYNTSEMFNFITTLEVKQVTASNLTDLQNSHVQKICTEIDGNKNNAASLNVNMKEVVVMQNKLPYMDFNFVMNFGESLLLKNFNERTQRMYHQCFAIGQACVDFNKNKSNIQKFVCTLQEHLMNLYHLTTEENTIEEKSIESPLKVCSNKNVFKELTESVNQIFKNATKDVKKIDNEYLQQLRTEINSKDDIIHRSTCSNYEIILERTKNNIPSTTQPEEILSCFDEQLSLLVDEIGRKLNENYLQYESNREAFFRSQPEARTILAKICLKTKNDFANENFHTVMSNFNNGVQLVNHSSEIERIMENLFSLYKELFLTENSFGQNLSELDILNTCKVLKKSSTVVLHPLKTIFTTCNKFYDTHLPFFEHTATMNMMLNALKVQREGFDMTVDSRSSLFFNIASEKLDFDEITPKLWMEVSDERETFTQPINNNCPLSEEKIRSGLTSLCDKFFHEIERKWTMKDDNERAERLKHAYDYFIKNFITLFQEMENESHSNFREFLKMSELFFDPRRPMFNRLTKVICETNKSKTFTSVEKYFTDEKNFEALVEKYISSCPNTEDFRVEMYESNGVRLFLTNKSAGILTEQDYMLKASRLFKFNVNGIEFIKMENDTAVLKYLNFYVTFLTTGDYSMIVAKIDNCEPSKNCEPPEQITSEVSNFQEVLHYSNIYLQNKFATYILYVLFPVILSFMFYVLFF